MSIEGQRHFFSIYFPGFVCFLLYQAKISDERLQDHWSSGFVMSSGAMVFRRIALLLLFIHVMALYFYSKIHMHAYAI